MTGLLSLPSELLLEIIEICAGRERCCLRATCKVLKEHADPIVFRLLRLYLKDPHITEHQIISLATQSSKACEFTRNMQIVDLPDVLHASEESWPPQFGDCDDLRVYLPIAISKLKNVTAFRWFIDYNGPEWLIFSLMQTVARLPQLTELDISGLHHFETLIPLDHFTNLSKLTVGEGPYSPFLISEIATVIANSPRLRSLRVVDETSDSIPLPTLSTLFAKIPTNNPLRLENLALACIDATVDEVVLPHLKHLTSFYHYLDENEDLSITRSVWTSFLNNNIKLTNVEIDDYITEEMILYLSSYSGLTILSMDANTTMIIEEFLKMLFEVVIPKHAKSLQTLQISDTSLSTGGSWIFNRTNSKSIMNCLNLRELCVEIDGKESGMPVQLLLDTVAQLPELKILRFWIQGCRAMEEWVEKFKPRPGLRYVEELYANGKQYVLEREGGRPVKYHALTRGLPRPP